MCGAICTIPGNCVEFVKFCVIMCILHNLLSVCTVQFYNTMKVVSNVNLGDLRWPIRSICAILCKGKLYAIYTIYPMYAIYTILCNCCGFAMQYSHYSATCGSLCNLCNLKTYCNFQHSAECNITVCRLGYKTYYEVYCT